MYYMSTSTVTIKGTATIPKEIREHLGITPGVKVSFNKAQDGTVRIEKVYSLEEIRERNQKLLQSKKPIDYSQTEATKIKYYKKKFNL